MLPVVGHPACQHVAQVILVDQPAGVAGLPRAVVGELVQFLRVVPAASPVGGVRPPHLEEHAVSWRFHHANPLTCTGGAPPRALRAAAAPLSPPGSPRFAPAPTPPPGDV